MQHPWMPLYIPDFLSDTMHLSAAETGAYLCLIMDYWLHDGLPDDDHKLAQIARVPVRSWRTMRPTIEAFFRPTWRHKRIDAELAKMVRISTKRQEAASKAGTVSAIKRATGTSTPRTRNVHATSTQRAPDVNVTHTQRAPDVHHLTQEDITSTFVGAARASQNQQNPPENEPNEAKQSAPAAVAAPQGLAEKAREAVQKSTGIGSGELVATMQAKGWVP
jgi:uncharacterized protein YdaU (DUF1376 family)